MVTGDLVCFFLCFPLIAICPLVTLRQTPEGGRWVYGPPAKTTHYRAVYQVSPHVWSPFSPKSMRFCPRMSLSPSRSWKTPSVIPYRVLRTGIRPGTWTAQTALLPRAGSAGADRRGTARSRGTLRPTPALSGFCAIWISGVMRERRSPPSTPITTYMPSASLSDL